MMSILFPLISMILSAWLLVEIRVQNKAIEFNQKKWTEDYEQIKRILDKIKKTLPDE